MNIFLYWARAEQTVKFTEQEYWLSARGWSHESQAAAETHASLRLARLVERTRKMDAWSTGRAADYGTEDGYDRCPTREELIETFPAPDGTPLAHVTRNRQGCLVLNTARAMFIDVDLPRPPRAKRAGCLAALLGAFRSPAPPPPPVPEGPMLERLRTVLPQQAGLSFRIYRTMKGFRLLVVNREFVPGAAESEALMQAVDVDPFYLRLCRLQLCFRARLTPKPERCGWTRLGLRYPYNSAEARDHHAKWSAKYTEHSAGYGTCQFVQQVGDAAVLPSIAPLLALHDQLTRVGENLPLA